MQGKFDMVLLTKCMSYENASSKWKENTFVLEQNNWLFQNEKEQNKEQKLNEYGK